MKVENRRTCPVCGTLVPETSASCPVCMLRGALKPEGDSSGSAVDSSASESELRFEHYRVLQDDDGTPIELGHGAMGVTYKAYDVSLRCPVALKVISERYLGDESARLRFLCEARTAARVRHSNVASVLYLGESGGNYFYAMEFVEGETLEAFIKHFGRLEVRLALEITSQVAAGLAAVHEQDLVHRDIKSANIMVNLKDDGRVTAKIIDLGLAKAVNEPLSEAAISVTGAFTGTPWFASPEQFAGIGVDIRSDLYSLGVTLWEMLTGQVPFRGSAAEVMYEHLHAPLPLEAIKDLPKPVVALLKSLLAKNPVSRPQSPTDLLALLGEARAVLDKSQSAEFGRIRGTSKQGRGETPYHNRLRRSVARAQNLRVEAHQEKPGLVSAPWDFDPFLAAKLKNFTGRKWLFEEIDEWLTKGCQPALLIIGEPGVGKSSIVAALVNENAEGQVLAYHCCRADTPATLEPAAFVRSLAAMFSSQLEGYAAVLKGAAVADALQFAEIDAASAFERAILGPLHKFRQPEGGRRYLLIDALDEALMRTQRPTIVDLLSTRLNLLPPWLRIVATTRNEPSVLSQLGNLRAHTLSAEDPRNQDDVRNFIHRRLAEPALRDRPLTNAKTLTALASTLLRSSAGNFLFVTTALDAVESGQIGFDQIATLSPGLSSLYELFFNRLFRDAGVDFGWSRQVLEVVAGASEPLTRKDIAAATGLDPEQLPFILARLASFVPPCEGRYAFFHKSLFDWLTGWDLQHDQPVAGLYHVSLEKGQTALADWCWTAWKRERSKVPVYALRHLVCHLHQVGRTQEARTVLLEFDFVRAKLEATDPNALIADYEYFSDEADLQLVQSAVRLSAHVLTRDRRELRGQLTGRLLGTELASIRAFLQGAAEENAGAWLRPLTPSLTQPGGPLICTLEDHMDWVRAVAVTSEGRRAVSGSHDCTLRLWDLESGQTIRTLEGHTDQVHAVAVTPEGRRAVSGSLDCTLRLWDLESGQTMRTLQGHTDGVSGVAVTPDGRKALSCSRDRMLRLWDLESGQTICTLEGHTGVVHAVAVTPDGRRAVSNSDDRTLRLWDLESGQTIRTLEGHTNPVYDVAVTPDGGRAVSASNDGTLRVWDLEIGQSVRTLEGHGNTVTGAVAITPDGRRGVSAGANYTVSVWDLETGQSLRTLQGHTDWVVAVAITPDGHRAISASADHTLRVWDLETGQSLRPPEGYTDGVTAVTLLPDGRGASLTSDYHTLRVWDLESSQLVHTLQGHTDWVSAVAVTPDGGRAVSASADGMLRVWNLESGESLRILQGHTDCVTAVAVTHNGRFAISASADRTLRVWDLENGQSLGMLKGHTDLISTVAMTADGRRALWGSNIGALRLWDLKSGQPVRTLEGHTDWVTAVAITPNGRRAVSASVDETLRVWNLESDQSPRILQGPIDRVNALAVTPDGRRAIAASVNHMLRVWNLENGEYIAGFTGEGPISRFAIRPDGRTIIANEKSGRVHFVRLDGMEEAVGNIQRPR
jgi:WD40 repeat protein/serine/threonine protein kinase